MFKFESLEVYQRAVEFAHDIYLLTKKFPQEELFGLTTQLRRAAVSISSNVAEGSSRSKKQFSYFLGIARGSVHECVPLLKLSQKQNLVADVDHARLYDECNRLAMMMNALKRSLSRSTTNSEGKKTGVGV